MPSLLVPGRSSRITSWALLAAAAVWFVASFAAIDALPWWNLVAASCLLVLAFSFLLTVQVITPMRHPERAEQHDEAAVAARWRDPRRHERLARFGIGFAIVCGVFVVVTVAMDPARWWSSSLYLVMGVSSGFQARDQFRHAARLRDEREARG